MDIKAPAKLRSMQLWFGKVIRNPLASQQTIRPVLSDGEKITETASHWIVPSPYLQPFERIELYNQQYWWRLFNVLRDSYPLVARMFGIDSFIANIAEPFLLKHNPNHWSLHEVTRALPEFLDQFYFEADRKVILDAARIDQAFDQAFIAKSLTSLKEAVSGKAPSEWLKISLQPHTFLFSLSYNLFYFRQLLLEKPPEYWEDQPLPKLEKSSLWMVLYRDSSGFCSWEAIEMEEFQALQIFKEPHSIEEACEKIRKISPEVSKKAESELSNWFQRWTSMEWLALKE